MFTIASDLFLSQRNKLVHIEIDHTVYLLVGGNYSGKLSSFSCHPVCIIRIVDAGADNFIFYKANQELISIYLFILSLFTKLNSLFARILWICGGIFFVSDVCMHAYIWYSCYK